MRYREIIESIENDDDELFAPRFQFGNLSRPEALEKYYDLYDELYGYESYWHGDEPEFEEKERELEHLKIYVRQRFGEAFYNHMVGAEQTRDTRSDVFSKKDPFSNRQHREDPRVTKAGKLHKQDVLGLKNDVKNRIGKHTQPVLPESDDDDDLFASPRLRFGDFFNEYDEDQLQALGFSYGDYPEQDVDIINHYLEDGPVSWRVVKLTGTGDDIVLHLDRSSRLGENDDSDDDMFAKRGIERVNMRSIEVDGIDHRDAPDYVDAHVSYATFNDGTELDHAQLDWLTDELANSGKLHELVYDKLYEDNTDDELFGTSSKAGQRMIYTYGKQLLNKLEQAYNTNPQIKQEYRELTWNEETDEPLDRTDTDAQFQLVLRATGAKFGKAFVVDSIIRDFGGGMEGLNDFGWMIDDGIFDELTNGWEEFGRSATVADEDWFRKELQTFMGDR